MSLREYLDKNMHAVSEKELLERCLKRGKKISECMDTVSEAMAPEKAANVAKKLRRGLESCEKKFRGDQAKVKACKDRLNKIIAKVQAQAKG